MFETMVDHGQKILAELGVEVGKVSSMEESVVVVVSSFFLEKYSAKKKTNKAKQNKTKRDLISQLDGSLACVAGAKRGGGGGREKGKREGNACSKSLCFCITPTNFLVIRLRLLSIKCRYTRHAEKHYTLGLKKFA